MEQNIYDLQAEQLCQKIKHYLITTMGRVEEEAGDEEFYRAFCFALREEIMINWLAGIRTYEKENTRRLYYLSMEFLPGRFLSNSIRNLQALEIVQLVMKKMGRDFKVILSRELEPGLGNGGLGRLASGFLDSLSTLHLPAMGYGLRYQYGIFEQQLWEGVQVEKPDLWLLNENPWEFRRDLRRTSVQFCGISSSEEPKKFRDFEEVWALPYDYPIIGYKGDESFSVTTLRLWTTKESPRNFKIQKYNAGRLDQAAENTALTDVLYPSDYHETGKRIRLKQEFLLVSASLQDIIRRYKEKHSNFDQFADKVRIQINDTHPALAIAELMRLLTEENGVEWNEGWEMIQQIFGFTNHTILHEALEEWDLNLINYLLPKQYRIIERINHDFLDSLRKKEGVDEEMIRRLSIIENGRVRMSHLAIVGSHKVNGVAKLHTEILKNRVFKDFYLHFPEKFTAITNGVSQRRWLFNANPELTEWITKKIDTGWIKDFSQIQQLRDFAGDPTCQREFLEIKIKKKKQFLKFLVEHGNHRDRDGIQHKMELSLDSNALIDVQVKRFHEYKRQLLNALHLLMVFQEIKEGENRIPRLSILGGKAAPTYETAKKILLLFHCISRTIKKDPKASSKLQLIVMENYNVSKAEKIIPAADLSEQISLAGMEASGTGNMKFAMNGALTIGTEDGANIEMKESITEKWWPLSFGCRAEEISEMQKNGSYRPQDLLSHHPKIAQAVDLLRDGSLTENSREQEALNEIYYSSTLR